MPVAAIYDIHGNLPALEAVLEELGQLQVDRIVVGGDVIVGPMSSECLDVLMNVKIPINFIKGNCEVSVLDQINSRPLPLPESVIKDITWTAAQMSKDQIDFINSWPMTSELTLEGCGRVHFCHATPKNENEIFTRETSVDKLQPIFEDLDVDMVVCGHTHMQFDRMVGNVRVINAGSVGMPFGEPGAYWLLIGDSVELKKTSYDLQSAAQLVLGTTYPGKEEFANKNLLSPSTEVEMLALFRGAELL